MNIKQILKESINEVLNGKLNGPLNGSINNYNHEIEKDYHGKRGAGILPFCTTTKKFLIALRSDQVLEPRTWGIWGGAIDDVDIDTATAARREFEEETEFEGEINLIPAYLYRDGKFTYQNYIGILDYEFNPWLNWESDDYQWISYEDLLKKPNKHFGLSALIQNSKNLLEKLNNG